MPPTLKSYTSTESTSSNVSTWSEDSFTAGKTLTGALTTLLDDNGILLLRKELSHNAKKIDPATRPARNVRFVPGTPLEAAHDAYKAEVDKIKHLKIVYEKAQSVARRSPGVTSHERCIDAAFAWKEQAVKAGEARLQFIKANRMELEKHFTKESVRTHIRQGEDNLRSANAAFKEIKAHENCKAVR